MIELDKLPDEAVFIAETVNHIYEITKSEGKYIINTARKIPRVISQISAYDPKNPDSEMEYNVVRLGQSLMFSSPNGDLFGTMPVLSLALLKPVKYEFEA